MFKWTQSWYLGRNWWKANKELFYWVLLVALCFYSLEKPSLYRYVVENESDIEIALFATIENSLAPVNQKLSKALVLNHCSCSLQSYIIPKNSLTRSNDSVEAEGKERITLSKWVNFLKLLRVLSRCCCLWLESIYLVRTCQQIFISASYLSIHSHVEQYLLCMWALHTSLCHCTSHQFEKFSLMVQIWPEQFVRVKVTTPTLL